MAAASIPRSMKAVVLRKADGKPGQVWHPIDVAEVPTPQLEQGSKHILIKLHAAALNHREVFIRQYSILGADGAGQVVAPPAHPLLNKAVLVAPEEGWKSSRFGPDQATEFGILGGTRQTRGRGTFAQYISVNEEDVVECPEHLVSSNGASDDGWEQAAALPLAALTAYRAVFTKAEVEKGQNVLITGIGGGVAIQALQFAVAVGANVFVSSGSPEKLEAAAKLGAKGGVNYKEEDWPKKLQALLPKDRPYLDSVVDSAGGNIVTQLGRILKHGARVSVYGQTTGKPHTLGMAEILKNIELRGSTMGSLAEFKEAVAFVGKHKLRPVIHKTVPSLDQAEDAFQAMKNGEQFGKLVVRITHDADDGQNGNGNSKL